MDDWVQFFEDLSSFIVRLQDQEQDGEDESGPTCFQEASDVIITLDRYIMSVSNLSRIIEESGQQDRDLEELKNELSDILDSLKVICLSWVDKEAGILNSQEGATNSGIHVYHSGGRGRPRFVVPTQTLQLLRELNFSWTQIAKILGISRRTLFSVRQCLGFEAIDPGVFSTISDVDLTQHIRRIKRSMPDAGARMIKGALESQGVHVPFLRVREVLLDIDPEGTQQRWASVIRRRRYAVSGPNALWHIDGHHKLIRWRMVTHGGIDGFTRFIVFLRCSTNNTSENVLRLFRAAVREYGLPRQVRSDRGGENVKVAEYMLRHSSHMSPMLTGASTHNQRIERLWRDVFRCVISVYHQIFYHLEECGKLDPLCDLDLYCLHLVYLPKINEALTTFADGWNSHAITTEHGRTPLQLFCASAIVGGSDTPVLGDNGDENTDDSTSVADSVIIPSTNSFLDAEKHAHLCELLRNESRNTNFNIDTYDLVREFVHANAV